MRATCMRARRRWIASEISRLDEQIGLWSTLFADRAPVPSHVWALVAEKQNLEIELGSRSREEPATYPGAATVMDQEIDHREGPIACLLQSMAGSPLLGGFLVGLAVSASAVFFLTCALC